MSLAESTLVAYGRRTVFDAVGAKADLELWNALNDAIDMLAQDHRWPWYLRKAYWSLQTPYTTGTITVTNASTTITGSGTTFPAWAASGNLLIAGKVYGVATRSSGTVLLMDDAFGGDTASGLSYVLFQDEYALPDNLYQFKGILPGQSWGGGAMMLPIEEVWALQNMAMIGQQYPDHLAIANNLAVLYPYPSENNTLAYTYYARPTPVTGTGSATLDWPDAHRQLLNRAYDFHLALRFGKTIMGDAKTCLDIYERMLAKAKVSDRSPRDVPGMMELQNGYRETVPDWKRRTS